MKKLKKNLKIKQLFNKIVILYLKCTIYWFSENKLFKKAEKNLWNPEKIRKQINSRKTYCMKRIIDVWEFEKIKKPGKFTVKHIWKVYHQFSESIWKKPLKYENWKKIRKPDEFSVKQIIFEKYIINSLKILKES